MTLFSKTAVAVMVLALLWQWLAWSTSHHFEKLQQSTNLAETTAEAVEAAAAAADYKQSNAEVFSQLRMPSSDVSLALFRGEEPLRFLHIIKTGGESFEGYLGSSPDLVPQMDYKTCRQTSMANLTSSSSAISTTPCWVLGTTISILLCGLNCECCAADMHKAGRFHGTLIRSPRAHTISLFSHGHTAHHTTWERMVADKTNYLAEAVLRVAEYVCGHAGTGGVRDWKMALQDNLRTSLSMWPPPNGPTNDGGVQVISLRNTQSHALTCSKSTKGSLGQHFRVLPQQQENKNLPSAVDSLEPNVEEALATLYRMEWIGITDLYHPSLCLLHYQANQTLPVKDCDCRHKHHHTNDKTTKPLGYWVEYRTNRRSTSDLPPNIVEMMDAHTTVDEKLFVAALRLVLGRLRRVEEITGASLLECVDWQKLRHKTDYIPALWTGGPDSLLVERIDDNKGEANV